MCDPVTASVVLVGASAGQAAFDYKSKKAAADDYNDAADRAFALTRKQSSKNFELQIRNITRRSQESQDAAAQEAQAIDRQYREVLGSTQVIQSDAGVGGAASSDVRSEFALRSFEAISANRSNARSDQARLVDEMLSARLAAENTNLGALPQYVAGPSILPGIFSVLNTAASTALDLPR